ncbi:MAG: hypothetical protein ABIW36_13090 [Terrimesophilobacter sp.]
MTSYSRPEENTLGIIVGKRQRRGVPEASVAALAIRQASAHGASLGTGYLGVGAGVLAGIQAAYGLTLFFLHFDIYPNALPIALGWLIYVISLLGVVLMITIAGARMPNWLFATFVVLLGLVITLDLVALWPVHNIGAYATASASVGFGLLLAVTLRRALEIVICTGLVAAALVIAILLTTPLTSQTLPAQIVLVALAVLPPLAGVYVVHRFRRMVQLELDRVLVQSTISAPRFAVGMLASEELARLDLAAEDLLDSVATGRTQLPLKPKTASIAASLATELRLHLIEGRRETWLYHAITESEQLGKSATLIDRGSLAGLLNPQQRDGLLAAVWLLVSDKPAATPTVQVTLGPMAPPAVPTPAHTITIPIVITTTGVARNRVDPATWGAIGRVGRFVDSTENSSLRVDIVCVAANPSDQYHSEQSVQR